MVAFYGDGGSGPTHDYIVTTTAAMSTAVWHLVTCVYTGNQNVTIYIDATVPAQTNNGGTGTLAYSTGNSQVNEFGVDGVVMDATIDDLRLYSRALAPWEIMQIYQQGLLNHN
jgi:hypothetical protein